MAMQGPIRSLRVTLTLFGLACWLDIGPHQAAAAHSPEAAGAPQAAGAKDAPGGQEAKPKAPAGQEKGIELSEFFGQPGDDPPRAFLPLRPSTTDDRRRLDVVRLYSTGRALEDRRAWTDA